MDKEIITLLKSGVYDQNAIFKQLYPKWTGHYSVLRNKIARIKNNGIK